MDTSAYIIAVLSALLAYSLYNNFNQPPPLPCPPCPAPTIVGPHTPVQTRMNIVESRDRAVLYDTLYPPVSRDTTDNTTRLLREPRLMPDRDSTDTFRLIGYLVNSNDNEDVWKLLARQTTRSQADFYAESSNRKLDIKVPLTSETARAADGSNTRPFRDIDNLPDAVTITHPMFKQGAVYNVVQLPRSSLGSGYI